MPCQELWAWAGGQQARCRRAHPRTGSWGRGAGGYTAPLMEPSPSTGRGAVIISQGISVIMPELMVQHAWACRQGDRRDLAAICSSTQSSHRYEATGPGDLGTEESKNPTSSLREQQAEGRAGFVGEGAQLQ